MQAFAIINPNEHRDVPEPKYVIAMGACTITWGMFSVDSPSAVRGVDKLIPVDIYIPGCPPRPEAVIDAIIKLRKKIANESMQERQQLQQTHRYYSITHRMNVVDPIVNGQYLQSSQREIPPQQLAAPVNLPLPIASATQRMNHQ